MAKSTKALTVKAESKVEKTMTTAQVAEVLGVTPRSVQMAVEKLAKNNSRVFADIRRNSQGGYLFSEQQVTAIKLELQNHSKVNALSPKTTLEKQLLIQQAMQIQAEMIAELQAKNLEQAQRVQELEHQVEYNEVIDCKRWTDVKKEYHLTRLTKAKVKNSLAEREFWFEKCMGMDKFPTLLIKPEAIDLLVELNKKQ